jgi:AAA+ ATPase superfamily predicted ATPase
MATNPFVFGSLALDEAFADREAELRELRSDLLNGQDVVVFAPRRYGKTSLVLQAAQHAMQERVLVAYCDLSRAPTKERLAAKLAQAIHDDIASLAFRAKERALAVFRGLRVQPTVELDPESGGLTFTFEPSLRRQSDIDETIERLLELPARIAADRDRRAALVFDEFQEITTLDPQFPRLLRAVFQAQPQIAHVYLGSRRHLMERIFSDENEPFWRSAKHMEIGPIPADAFVVFLAERFRATGKALSEPAARRMLELTGGHPYGTQQIAYFTWEAVEPGASAFAEHVDGALETLLRSEHRHFTRIWEESTRNERVLLLALADGPGRPYSEELRRRYSLPSETNVQRALTGLVREELVAREGDTYRIVEPFLAEWLLREQAADRDVLAALGSRRRR